MRTLCFAVVIVCLAGNAHAQTPINGGMALGANGPCTPMKGSPGICSHQTGANTAPILYWFDADANLFPFGEGQVGPAGPQGPIGPAGPTGPQGQPGAPGTMPTSFTLTCKPAKGTVNAGFTASCSISK